MKLVYLLQWDEDPFASLKAKHDDMDFVRVTTPGDAAREVADADILVVGGPYYVGELAAAVNAGAPRLRWLQSASIGTDKFEEGGVPETVTFTNAAGLKGKTVAEHAMAMLLGHVHALPQMERFKSRKYWGRDDLRSDITCLEGTTLLLLGYGSIGEDVARKAKAFDMHVVALNRSGEGASHADIIQPVANLTAWLPKADFVLCTLPLTAETRHMIGAKEFSMMKPGALLINVGRGANVDHAALTQALLDKKIAGACLDVFDAEPMAADDPLWEMPNVIISPHVAGTGGPIVERFTGLVAENISRFKDGRVMLNELKIVSS